MIDANQYLARMVSVIEQFKLARRMVDSFASSKDTLGGFAVEEAAELRAVFARVADSSASPEVVQRRTALMESYEDFALMRIPNRINDVANRLNQNELILLVALLEVQIKDIHREMLTQEPGLLKTDRTVPIGKLVSLGAQAIVAEEIEREVQSQDRRSTETKAEYFVKTLRLDWFDGTMVPLVDRVVKRRNELLHQDPDVVVSDVDVEYARFVSLTLPMYLCLRAAERHPLAFQGFSHPKSPESAATK